MAAATAPGTAGRSLLGHLKDRLQFRAALKGRASRAAAVIGDHAGTMTALGFADAAAWQWGPFWGLLATGIAVVIAEDKIRG